MEGFIRSTDAVSSYVMANEKMRQSILHCKCDMLLFITEEDEQMERQPF